MKVLHIITRMNTGGPAVFLDHLTKSMADLGTKSIIAYGYCESNETDYTDTHKLNADLIRVQSLHRSLSPISDIRSFFQLRKIIKTQKPDVVNTHTSKAGVLARLATKSVSRKTPVVHTFHGHLIYGYFARYKSIVFTLIEKIMSRFTNVAVAVTAETKNSLTKLGIGRNLLWRVIQIGIPVRVVTQTTAAEQTFKLLWIGRFTQIKDPSLAVKVMKNLSNAGQERFELTMVGEGELYEEVKQEANNLPVKFTGWLTNPFETISAFDLLLITSKNEGLPLVMLEAANFAKPTLSKNVGGISEFITDNQTGYLVDGSADEIAKRIVELSNNKGLLLQTGINANKLLNEKFSVEIMAKSYQDLYLQLVISK
jgi:glycosyltransferase involved in cell wall biosynthesis